jgi:surface antigen
MKFVAFRAALFALLLGMFSTAASALQCVPYAREISGIEIHGNARTWWRQAAGIYDRGTTPQVGAVMAFKPIRSMPIGHVATVSQIVSDREVLVSHANWSRINGRRGQIERNVRVLDVSEAGDWSKVRVWYAPLRDLGSSTYPLYGFIYGGKKAPTPAMPRDTSPLIGPDIYRLAALESAV